MIVVNDETRMCIGIISYKLTVYSDNWQMTTHVPLFNNLLNIIIN